MIQDQAFFAGNGPVLAKENNAVLDHLDRSPPYDKPVGEPGRGHPLRYVSGQGPGHCLRDDALRLTPSRLAVPVIITLKEY